MTKLRPAKAEVLYRLRLKEKDLEHNLEEALEEGDNAGALVIGFKLMGAREKIKQI